MLFALGRTFANPKKGGLGIRDMELVNKSLIIHSAWNVATNKNPFLTAILKAKYYPNHSFWTAPINGTRSVYWSSVMQVKDELAANSKYQLMWVIPPYGHRLGPLCGIRFMITFSCQ